MAKRVRGGTFARVKKDNIFGLTSGAQDGNNRGDEDKLNPGEHGDARIRNESCT